MLPRYLTKFACLFGLLLLLGFSVLAVGAQPRYLIQDLGTVDNNARYVHATGINDNGTVVGFFDAGLPVAFVWTQASGMKQLDLSVSAAYGINNKGQITGWYNAGYMGMYIGQVVNHAVRWELDGSRTDLHRTAHLRDSFDLLTNGNAINSSGQVAGAVTEFGTAACFWASDNDARMGIFGTFNGTSSCDGINDSGTVVGWGSTEAGPHAFRYSQTKGLENLHPANYGASLARCINSSGVTAGELTAGKMVLWDAAGKMEIIGDGKPLGINDAGTVVGYNYSTQHAFVWTRPGPPVDLNQVLVNGEGWTLNSANGINNKGQIVGYGEYQGKTRAFLLTPFISINITAAKLTAPTFVRNAGNSYLITLYLKGQGQGHVTGHWILDGHPLAEEDWPNLDLSSGGWTPEATILIPWTILQGNHSLKFVLDSPSNQETGSINGSITGFDPIQHGWKFINGAPVDQLWIGICLGMSREAWFDYQHHIRIPQDYPLPSRFTYFTLLGSHFTSNSWFVPIDRGRDRIAYGTGIVGDSLAVSAESDRIRNHLQTGSPWVMGLIVSRSISPFSDTRGHAVVATGTFYCANAFVSDQPDLPFNVRRFEVYDPNLPGRFREVDMFELKGMFSMDFVPYGSDVHTRFPVEYSGN